MLQERGGGGATVLEQAEPGTVVDVELRGGDARRVDLDGPAAVPGEADEHLVGEVGHPRSRRSTDLQEHHDGPSVDVNRLTGVDGRTVAGDESILE